MTVGRATPVEEDNDKKLAEVFAEKIANDRENLDLFLTGEPKVMYQLMQYDNGGLSSVCTHYDDDLRCGDRIEPYKGKWLFVEEIWKPSAIISTGGKVLNGTLIAVVRPSTPPDGYETTDA